MKIFMSDLDNTLIYSYKHEIGEEKPVLRFIRTEKSPI